MLPSKSALALLSLAAIGNAASCPKNWLENSFKVTRCCYGGMIVDDTTAYCCVYKWDEEQAIKDSYSASDVSTTEINISASRDDPCFTSIPFTATDYSAQVSAASSKIMASTTAPSTNRATATSTSTSTGSASPTSTPNAGMPQATANGMMLGGAAAAVALFV